MDAIKLLKSQHREVEDLFSAIEKAEGAEKEKLFTKLADSLAIHATIEEHHFYPAVKERRTEDILLESLEEHLAIKRVLSDLLDVEIEDETFDAKLTVLQEEVEHHVKEEEEDLFPKVSKILSAAELDALGEDMSAEQAELEGEAPRMNVPEETDKAAPL